MAEPLSPPGRITRAARNAVLVWFSKRSTARHDILAQLLEDLCLGDVQDLCDYVGNRYGKDAQLPLEGSLATDVRDPTAFSDVLAFQQSDEARAEAALLTVPDPVFLEALESAKTAMAYKFGEHGNVAPEAEATAYIARVFATHGVEYRLSDDGKFELPGSVAEAPLSAARPSLPTLIPDAADVAIGLFGVRWDEVTVAHVEVFLNNTTDDEPLGWEVKGTELPATRDDIKKTVGGFANRDGGFYILGFAKDAAGGQWAPAPVEFPEEEPHTWLSRFIRSGIKPPPEVDIRPLEREGRRAIVVVQVQPNVGVLSMVNGRVPERWPGQTVWLEDGPSLANALRRVESRSRSLPRAVPPEVEDQPASGESALGRAELSVDLPPGEFAAVVKRILQEGHEADLNVFLAGMVPRVRAARDAGDIAALGQELDRVTDCVAVALSFAPESDVLTRAIGVLREAFDLGIGRLGRQGGAVAGEQLWVEVLGRVRALGALAIRLEQWEVLRSLILQEIREDAHRLWPFWFRYGDVWASRANLYKVGNDVLETSRRPFRLAAEHAMRLPSLHPDGVADEDALITAICRFDFLANALTLWRVEENRPAEAAYPYYAAWEGERVRPLVQRLIADTHVREVLLPEADDVALADLLAFLAHRAQRGSEGLGSWMFWSGFADSYIQRFIANYATPPQSA